MKFSRAEYLAHLASPYWHEFKQKHRPKYCQWYNGCLNFPMDPHHKSYLHFGYEKLYPQDILWLCRKHHNQIHFDALGKRRKNWREYNIRQIAPVNAYLLIILLILLLLSWIIYQIGLYLHVLG